MLWKGTFGSFGGINALPEGPSLESTPSLLGSLLMGEGSGGGAVSQVTWYNWATGTPPSSHQLRHRGSGFGCSDHGSWVTFAPICHPSVSAELSLPPAFPGPPSFCGHAHLQ